MIVSLEIAPSRRRASALMLAALVALGAAGCGRKGALEPPPDPSAVATPAPQDSSDPTQFQGRKKPPPITPPHQSFVLDPLL